MKKVVIGSDHAGFTIKERIKEALGDRYQFIDVGTHSEERVDYPIYAEKVAQQVALNTDLQGVLVCGSGIGVTITANKIPGVRAALAYSIHGAKLAREHNDANVVATAGRESTIDDPVQIVAAFLSTPFSGNPKYAQRVEQIAEVEKRYLK